MTKPSSGKNIEFMNSDRDYNCEPISSPKSIPKIKDYKSLEDFIDGEYLSKDMVRECIESEIDCIESGNAITPSEKEIAKTAIRNIRKRIFTLDK